MGVIGLICSIGFVKQQIIIDFSIAKRKGLKETLWAWGKTAPLHAETK